MVRSVWLVGSIGGPWLVEEGGGEGERGNRGDALLEKVWLLHVLNKVWHDF
jgi:hypothetical protein